LEFVEVFGFLGCFGRGLEEMFRFELGFGFGLRCEIVWDWIAGIWKFRGILSPEKW
jgi:hypothetical protein